MVRVSWENDKQKSIEWVDAENKLTDSDGKILPNGSKLSRKTSGLSHSFMVIDNKIVVLNKKANYLGKGADGKVKLAEDKDGNIYALKITSKPHNEQYANEADIAFDIGISGRETSRVGGKQINKRYILYKYLGVSFDRYFEQNRKELTLDRRYELCTKIALSLNALHTGALSKTNKRYIHGDFHQGNIVIDNDMNPHIIDFGRSPSSQLLSEMDEMAKTDVSKLLEFLYVPPQNRDFWSSRQFFGFFGELMNEYRFYYAPYPLFSRFQIQLALEKDLIKNPNKTIVHYNKKNANGDTENGTIDLAQIGMTATDLEYPNLPLNGERPDVEHPNDRLAKKRYEILDLISKNGHEVEQNYNKTLSILLNKTKVTAMELAITCTVCRFNLESFQAILLGLPEEECAFALKVLNSQSQMIFDLYSQIETNNISNTDFKHAINKLLLEQCISRPVDVNISSKLNKLLAGYELKNRNLITKLFNEITDNINQEKTLNGIEKSYKELAKIGFFIKSSLDQEPCNSSVSKEVNSCAIKTIT